MDQLLFLLKELQESLSQIDLNRVIYDVGLDYPLDYDKPASHISKADAPNPSLSSSVADPSSSEPLVASECKAQIVKEKGRWLENFKNKVGPGLTTHQTRVVGPTQYDIYTVLNKNGLHHLSVVDNGYALSCTEFTTKAGVLHKSDVCLGWGLYDRSLELPQPPLYYTHSPPMPNTLIGPDGSPLTWDPTWTIEKKRLFTEATEANRRSLIEAELLRTYPSHNRQLGIAEWHNGGAQIRLNHFTFKRDSAIAELVKNISSK